MVFRERSSILISFLASLTLVAALSACGNHTYRTPDSESAPLPTPSWTPPPGGGGTGGGGGETVSGNPSITSAFDLNGVGGVKPFYDTGAEGIRILTDNLMKVRIRAHGAGPLTLPSGGSSFTANYACASFLVTVNGRSVRTKPLLANGQPSPLCPDGVAEQIINFSDRIAAANGDMTVKISEPRYDFYCQIWFSCQQYPNNYTYACASSFPYSYQNSYCPTRAVFKNHTVSGEFDVFTNED